MWQQDAYRMIQRRAANAGIKTRIGNHTFRATGITAYLILRTRAFCQWTVVWHNSFSDMECRNLLHRENSPRL
jgi:hypothetical protein